jgi:hypothetical protein
MGWRAHLELTIDVYCTFVFWLRAPLPCEIDIAGGRVEAEACFRMFEVTHSKSLGGFVIQSNIYTEEQTQEPIYTTAISIRRADA